MERSPQPYVAEQEIDLIELITQLYQRKVVIILCTLLATLIAIGIGYWLPKSYTAQAVISSSNQSHFYQPNINVIKILDNININSNSNSNSNNQLQSQGYITTGDQAFQLVEKQLTSTAIQRAAIKANNLPENKDLPSMIKSFTITYAKDQYSARRLIIEYKAGTADAVANVINENFIPLAIGAFIHDLEDNHLALKNMVLVLLNQEVNQMEVNFLAEADRMVKKLQDRLALIQIKNNTNLDELFQKGDTQKGDALAKADELSTEQLKTKINQIKNVRKQYTFYSADGATSAPDKPYINGVDSKVQGIKALESLTIDYSKIKPIDIEQLAVPPLHPKTRKTVIAVIGFMLGGMIGVFIALIQMSLSNRRRAFSLGESTQSSALSSNHLP